MRKQLANRLALPHVKDTMEQFIAGLVPAAAAAGSLGISRSRLYQLMAGYLRARAEGRLRTWTPGSSGGDHLPDWPEDVQDLLRRALAAGFTYAFAASIRPSRSSTCSTTVAASRSVARCSRTRASGPTSASCGSASSATGFPSRSTSTFNYGNHFALIWKTSDCDRDVRGRW